jgi:hypothetical protein
MFDREVEIAKIKQRVGEWLAAEKIKDIDARAYLRRISRRIGLRFIRSALEWFYF